MVRKRGRMKRLKRYPPMPWVNWFKRYDYILRKMRVVEVRDDAPVTDDVVLQMQTEDGACEVGRRR